MSCPCTSITRQCHSSASKLWYSVCSLLCIFYRNSLNCKLTRTRWVYVCLFVVFFCVCMCMCMCLHMHVEARSQHLVSSYITVSRIFPRQGLSLTGFSGWPASLGEPLDCAPHSHPIPSTVVTGLYRHALPFTWVLGVRTQVLICTAVTLMT